MALVIASAQDLGGSFLDLPPLLEQVIQATLRLIVLRGGVPDQLPEALQLLLSRLASLAELECLLLQRRALGPVHEHLRGKITDEGGAPIRLEPQSEGHAFHHRLSPS